MFYRLRNKAPKPLAAPITLSTLVYPGDRNEIPLTRVEAAVAAQLWQRGNDTIDHPGSYPTQDQPIRLLLVSCHGNTRPLIGGVLQTGAGQVLGMPDIVQRGGRIDSAYVSACLAGQTEEDFDGVPCGVVSGFFMKGARVVVGALVSIPDLWAMVLGVLVHQAMVREGLSLDRALQEGKRRLGAGLWYEDTLALMTPELRRLEEERLQALYGETLSRDFDKATLETMIENETSGWNLDEDTEMDLLEAMQRAGLARAPGVLADESVSQMSEYLYKHRIPEQPHLGTMLYGFVAYGEG